MSRNILNFYYNVLYQDFIHIYYIHTIYLQSQRQEIVVKIRNKNRRREAEKKSSVITFLSITLISSLHSCTCETGAEITSSLAILIHIVMVLNTKDSSFFKQASFSSIDISRAL